MTLQTGIVHASGATSQRAMIIAFMPICASSCSYPPSVALSASRVNLKLVNSRSKQSTYQDYHVTRYSRVKKVAQRAQKRVGAQLASR
jgi:hypothetical protein